MIIEPILAKRWTVTGLSTNYALTTERITTVVSPLSYYPSLKRFNRANESGKWSSSLPRDPSVVEKGGLINERNKSKRQGGGKGKIWKSGRVTNIMVGLSKEKVWLRILCQLWHRSLSTFHISGWFNYATSDYSPPS